MNHTDAARVTRTTGTRTRMTSGASPLKVLILAASLATALTACSSSGAPSGGASPEGSSALPPLRVGIAVDPPWTTKSSSGDLQGFNPEMLKAYGEYAHRQIDLVETGWTGIVAGLQTGQYDMVGADLNETPERAKVIDFTTPYYQSGVTWFVKGDSPLNSIADLNSPAVTVAFTAGSDLETSTRTTLPNAKYRSIPNASAGDLISELASGRSDAMANSNYVGLALIERYGFKAIPDLNTTPNGVAPVGIAWAVRKNDSSLLESLNAFLAKAANDGTTKNLEQKYLTPGAFAASVGL